MNRPKQDKRKRASRASRERKATKKLGPQLPRSVSPTPNSRDPLVQFFAPVPGRPVLNALRAAYLERWNRLREMPSGITEEFQRRASEGRLTDDYVKSHGEEMARYTEEWRELCGWINPKSKVAPFSTEKRLEIARLMQQGGWSAEDVEAVVRAPKYLTKGRPAKRRAITILAAEKKLADPSLWTWRKLALAFCNCDRKPHDENCAKNLRRQVLLLKGMLSRLKITLPATPER
jgi:hypothetical protein